MIRSEEERVDWLETRFETINIIRIAWVRFSPHATSEIESPHSNR